jgi:hypothetical protein
MSNIRRPITTAPVRSKASSSSSESRPVVPPSRPWRPRQLAKPYIHSWIRSPPSSGGCSTLSFGPVMNPSSDVVMSTSTFPV